MVTLILQCIKAILKCLQDNDTAQRTKIIFSERMTQVEAGEAQVEADRQEMKKLLDEIAQGARETREGCSYYLSIFLTPLTALEKK